jgi:hypothetical protein
MLFVQPPWFSEPPGAYGWGPQVAATLVVVLVKSTLQQPTVRVLLPVAGQHDRDGTILLMLPTQVAARLNHF